MNVKLALMAVLVTACASAPPATAPTRMIVFVTLTASPAARVTSTDAPLPFRDLSTLPPTATDAPPNTPTTSPADLPPAVVHTPTTAPADLPPAITAAPTLQPLAAVPSTPAPSPTAAALQPASDVASAEQAVIDLSNAYRAANGLPPLSRDEAVMAIARSRSADMVARGYFGHTDPITGVHLAKSQVLALGFGRAGENIYWGGTALTEFPAQAVGWFMGDAPHRANILGAGYTAIGVGIAWNGRGWALTQNFAGP